MVDTRPTVSKKRFLTDRARRIFEGLGYSVDADSDDETLSAERDDKVVRIAPLPETEIEDSDGETACPFQWQDDKYCFVADSESGDLERVKKAVTDLVPSGSDWVVMGVTESGYEVHG
ncbi:MAG: hypothetical protein SV253_08270 [Halobacteria archaeon]|nr:hypothetical protein [Halobacteria archaeon]